MSDLYPTKTRLALLTEVDADNVSDGLTDETDGDIWLVEAVPPFGQPKKVTSRVLELERACWVEQGPDGAFWRLTDAGREVLRGGREPMDVDEWVKEEPDCYACNDSGAVYVDADGETVVDCPSCRPTEEQIKAGLVAAEARRVEWERAVAAGEITPDEAPF